MSKEWMWHRRVWVRPILQRRHEQREFHNLLQEMCVLDTESHHRYLRSKEMFYRHLTKVCGAELAMHAKSGFFSY